MTLPFRLLFWQTLQSPATAAALVLQLGLGRNALWTALALACVLSTLLVYLGAMLTGDSTENALVLSVPASYIVVFYAIVAVSLIVMLFGIGSLMGGQARFEDILALMTWLQMVQVVAQFLSVVLMLFVPLLAGIFSVAAAVFSIWIMANFMNTAQGFNSLSKSFALIVLAFLGAVMGLVLFFSLAAPFLVGIPIDV